MKAFPGISSGRMACKIEHDDSSAARAFKGFQEEGSSRTEEGKTGFVARLLAI
jgi:hypothetical protein